MSHPPLVSSLVDVLVNGDEVAPGGTPEDSPLPLKKVSSDIVGLGTFFLIVSNLVKAPVVNIKKNQY